MTHSIEITSIDNKIPLLLQSEKDEIEEEGKKVDHLIELKETNGRDLLGSKTKKSVNHIFDKMFEDLDNSSIKSRTIFKVTLWLRESNPDAYTPKIVSIGPYHEKNPQLRPMKQYKLLYLRRFLRRKEGLDVESCISELEKVKEKAIKCYDDVEDLDNDSSTGHQIFFEMLLLDGCFVIEFIREQHEELLEGEDKIINVDSKCNKILRDLLLLENQLPFFVLTKLLNMTASQPGDDSFIETLVLFIWKLQLTLRAKLLDMNPASFADFRISNYEAEGNNIKHLLHVLHMSYRRNPSMDSRKSFCCNPLQIIRSKEEPNDTDYTLLDHDKILPSATELSEAGVRFEKVGSINSRSMWLFDKDNCERKSLIFDIKFKNGVMKIPCFQIVDDTESLLRNLIAYEQQSPDVCLKYFSDFVVFMDSLIDSEKDVSLLRTKGIIVSMMEEDKELANFFNRIGKGVVFSPDGFYYKEECRKAVQHCKKLRHRWMASLTHNYFSSPWAGASTMGDIILLILTAIQTVRAFHK